MGCTTNKCSVHWFSNRRDGILRNANTQNKLKIFYAKLHWPKPCAFLCTLPLSRSLLHGLSLSAVDLSVHRQFVFNWYERNAVDFHMLGVYNIYARFCDASSTVLYRIFVLYMRSRFTLLTHYIVMCFVCFSSSFLFALIYKIKNSLQIYGFTHTYYYCRFFDASYNYNWHCFLNS